MKIAVDAMGGDFAPQAAVSGAYAAAAGDGFEILLVGDQAVIARELARCGRRCERIEVVHAEETVGMDESAITPLRKKRRSSVRICAELVKADRAQAMVTAGNTGAAMAVAKTVIGTITGIDRPALAAVFPNPNGRTVVLDVGANVSTKPHHLRQFAVMGHFYAQEVLGQPAPRVGLMSVGEEEGKGTETTREVFKVLKSTGLDFVGNVEGRDLFNGTVDVVVCDGFVGNVVLKGSESLAKLLTEMLRQELMAHWRTRLGALLAMPALERLKVRTDPDEFGAAPLLGVRGGCFIGHGRSSAHGIRSSVRRAVEFASAQVHVKIRDKVEEMHLEERKLLGDSGHGEGS